MRRSAKLSAPDRVILGIQDQVPCRGEALGAAPPRQAVPALSNPILSVRPASASWPVLGGPGPMLALFSSLVRRAWIVV